MRKRSHLKAKTGAIFNCCPGAGNPEAKNRGRDYGSRISSGGVQVQGTWRCVNRVPGRRGAPQGAWRQAPWLMRRLNQRAEPTKNGGRLTNIVYALKLVDFNKRIITFFTSPAADGTAVVIEFELAPYVGRVVSFWSLCCCPFR